jgi:hypothetical protein
VRLVKSGIGVAPVEGDEAHGRAPGAAGGIRFNLAGRLARGAGGMDAPTAGRPPRALSFRRMARGDDLEPLLDLVETGHKESRFGYIPFSRDKARKIGERALADPARNLLIVAELRGRPVGFLFASIGEFHIGTDVRLATIHAVYTERRLRASLCGGRVTAHLFRALNKWAAAVGAREVLLHVTSGVSADATSAMSSKFGFYHVGGVLSARIE